MVVGLAAGWAAIYRHRSSAPRHIVLISIDTLRADHLSCYGYEKISTPEIDRLAREGTLFESAATATPLTLPAHASLFTGRTPLRHGVIDNFGFRLDENEETLAELLHKAGFATAGFVGSFVLDSRSGVGQGFETYFDRFESAPGQITSLESNQRPGDEVLSEAVEWIRGQGDRPFFAFVHFFDPHTPYAPPEPYRSRSDSGKSALYDGEIAFVDALIGRLVRVLEEQGLYDRSVILLLGDHGEALGDHGEETHGFFIYEESIRIPLIIKGPGAPAGARVKAQVRSIDVLPTVLDSVGVAPPPSVEGVSLLSLLRDPTNDPGLRAYIESHYTRLHFGWAPLIGVRERRYKFIDAPRPELYDLTSDPREEKNLAFENRDVARGLATVLEGLARRRRTPSADPAALDRETEERLRALGYITSQAGPTAEGDWKALPDPKDNIGTFSRLTEARLAIATGEADRAIEILRGTLAGSPGLEMANLMLGEAHLQKRQYRDAVAVFRAATIQNDRSPEARYGLALAYQGLGRLEEAAAEFESCLELDPRHDRAASGLAELRMAQGRPADAERLARQSLGKRPSSSRRLLLAESLLAQGRREEALSVLREAASEDPSNALVHLNLGNLLLETGAVDEAIAAYRRAESLQPESAPVQNGLGNAFARRGDTSAARQAFEKAVRLDPTFAPAHNNLGIALATLNRPQDAEKAFRSAIDADPAYAEAFNNLGFLYLRAGVPEGAIPLFRRAIELRPDYEQARANLSAALQARKR